MVGLITLGLVVLMTPLLTAPRVRRWLGRQGRRLVLRRARPDSGRALEQIALDSRRLARQFHHQPRGQSFMKYEAHRRAYDQVLAEGCRALEVEHLLAVLPPGPELDVERARVEYRLECAGLELGLPLT